MACFIDEDEDPVIEEIPVFLSKNLQDNLFVFQYPTKTQMFSFDNSEVVNCCVKPINQEVKVDFSLATESPYYDAFKGEQLAIAADGKIIPKGEKSTFKNGLMDKQSFVSSRSLQDVNKYIIGIYADKEIHLSPLSSIVQLRPSFSYFDKEDKRTKAEQKTLNEEDDTEEMQQVTVKFARTGAGGKKIKERQGYEHFVKKSIDEPWCETYWHKRTSPTAELERQKLFATNRQKSLGFSLEAQNYIKKLLPTAGGDQGIDAILPTHVFSKARLKLMPLLEQLKVLLKDARMLSFDDLLTILQQSIDPSITADKVIKALPQIAILIRGNWVPQSEILYPNETLSNANGVKSELMIRARDYLLFRFSRTQYLFRHQVIYATQLPPDEATEVLKTIAHVNCEKKWELLLPPDKHFEQRYPELVQRQEMVWRATEQTYNEMEYEKSPKRTRKRSQRDSKTYTNATATVLPTDISINSTIVTT